MKQSINRDVLTNYLNEQLNPRQLKDYCPNGLQVEGTHEIKKLITGVTASQRLLDEAVAWQADAILVHHGYFWKNESPCITGIKRQRLHTLLTHNINLFAYHLPLDVHRDWGNNAGLAAQLGLTVTGQHPLNGLDDLLWQGELVRSMSLAELGQQIAQQLSRTPTLIAANDDTSQVVKTLAWCTGGADNYIQSAKALGVDAYLSGELSESTVHEARESNIHYLACGHHATERYGVKVMADVLAETFQIKTRFIDCDNPA